MNKQREDLFCRDCGQLKQACLCQRAAAPTPAQFVRLQAPTGEKVVTTKGGERYYELIQRGWNEVGE